MIEYDKGNHIANERLLAEFSGFLIAGFVSYITIFQIKPEEEVLKTLFGEAYDQYCSNVRRWM